MTRDLDLTIFTGFGEEAPVIDDVLARYPGRRADVRTFALQYRVILCATSSGIPVDIALGALPFEAEMIQRAADVEFEPGDALRICTAEDLFVLKAFADPPQDRADILGIARRSGRRLDWDAVGTRLAPLVDAKGNPEIMVRVNGLRQEFET